MLLAVDTDGDGNGDNQTNLTKNPAGDYQPTFSPDGRKIAFGRQLVGTVQQVIYKMNANGTGKKRLTKPQMPNPATDLQPNFSPNGKSIAFFSGRDGNANVYVMRAKDGSGQQMLTNNAAFDVSPVFSPDGTKIAFVSYRDGDTAEIYVMDAAPESAVNQPQRLTNNSSNDRVPNWGVGL